jgi:transcriptional regulator with XRE-family HTH domain
MATGEKPQAQDKATHKAIALTFQFLKQRGVDQNAVAERLGVGHQIVSMVKTGKRTPSMRQIGVLSALAQETLNAGSLNQDEFVLAEQITVAWWKAIHAQMQAVAAMQRHVSAQLTSLQTDSQLTPEDLQRIAAYAAETQRLGMGLRHLAELGKAWQAEGRRLLETWERIKRERFPDGPPRHSQAGTRCRPHRGTRTPA